MSRHIDNISLLASMQGRLDTALRTLEQVVSEAGDRPQWTFLQARMVELEVRIAALCEDMQVAIFTSKGYYQPVLVKLTKNERRKQLKHQKRPRVA